MGDDCAGTVMYGRQIGIYNVLPNIIHGVLYEAHIGDTCVIYQYIHAAKGFCSLIYKRFCEYRIGNVTLYLYYTGSVTRHTAAKIIGTIQVIFAVF